jgi:uncharacterized membrane protein
MREGAGRRTIMMALSSAALADAAAVTMVQAGALRSLPEPRSPTFDTRRVVRSRVAYPLGIPDGTLGALNHILNLSLLVARGRQAGRTPLVGWLLAASVAGGAAGALFYGYQMLFRVRRLCPYCLAAIAINLSLVPLAWRELRPAKR